MAYNSKTIAKNTASLYVRTIIVLLISLYTSRVFLDALGVIDFGTYSAVGGVVGMISFLNSTLAAATSRYLTFELGKGDTERLKKTFNVSLSVHILLILFIVLIFLRSIKISTTLLLLSVTSGRIMFRRMSRNTALPRLRAMLLPEERASTRFTTDCYPQKRTPRVRMSLSSMTRQGRLCPIKLSTIVLPERLRMTARCL